MDSEFGALADVSIVPFRGVLAEPASATICRTLRRSNAPDYDDSVIEHLTRQYSPIGVASKANSSDLFVALAGSEVVGTIALETPGNDDRAWISACFVDPEHQRRGLGTRLLGVAEKLARARGARIVSLRSSLTALKFYEARGYSPVERVEDPAAGVAWVMEKGLSGA
ncbi:MAG: hypothetical protein Kow0069_30430 [Promethearchaeota archaeon]